MVRFPAASLLLLTAGVVVAGCAAPHEGQADEDPDEYTPPYPHITPGRAPPLVSSVCSEASPGILWLERHRDHSGGHSAYWVLQADGLLILEGNREGTDDGSRVEAALGLTAQEMDEACHALAGFNRPNPFTNRTNFHALDLGVHERVRIDEEALRGPLEAFWSLPEDSSAFCRSGGDTWLRIQDADRMHEIDASCAPNEAFREALEAFYDAVGRQPFDRRY